MRVYLTGGTGLIGSHVAEQLRERGDEVIALVRPTSHTGHLEALGCLLVRGDILDPEDTLAAGMRSADAVVHAAAKVFQGGSRKAFLRVNLEGTEAVLRAAGRVAPRVVHVSSVAVYAGLPMADLHEARWTEADPDRQKPYAASKHLSERAAWRLHREGVIRLTTVRPCVAYGERDRAATPVIVRYATRPVVPLIGGGRTALPLVYAGNVARGVVAALDRDTAVGRIYNLAQDNPITGRELVGLVSARLGRTLRTISVPGGLAVGAARAVAAVTRFLPLLRSFDGVRLMRGVSTDNPYDSSRARLELGWGGHVAHEEGIRRTLTWWESR